ncbi:hypothetical protein N9230_00845, partial [Akkermansiaceae bacterium]|nr:hypothetical protein [Akkermansiaceae bacterium]
MNDDLQSFIELELEARLVALILGEASAFEEEELDRILKARPEVALAKQRLEEIHGLIGQAVTPSEDDEEWKLSSQRREKVLAVLGEASTTPEKKSQPKERRISIAQWRSIYATAACLMVAVVVLALVAPMSQQFEEIPELVSYSAEEGYVEESNLNQKGRFEDQKRSFAKAEPESSDRFYRRSGVQPDEILLQESQDQLLGLEKKRASLKSELNSYFLSSNEDGREPSDRTKAVKEQLAAIDAGLGV